MRQMIRIYRRAFRLHHKKYLPKALGWFLIAVLQAPVYVLMVLRFDDLFNGIEPVRNGLIVIGLATMGYVLRLIADLNLFQTAMVSPTCDLQVGIFKHFLRLPPRRYAEIPSGDLTNVLFTQIIGGWFLNGFIKSGYFLVLAAGLIFIIARVSLLLALVSTIPILILSLIPRTMGKTMVTAHGRSSRANARFESFITDTLNGILTVKLFNAAAFHVRRVRELARVQNLRWLKTDFLMVGINTLTMGIAQLAVPLFLVTGGYLVAQGAVSAAQLVPLFLVVNLANQSLVAIGILMGYALNYGGQLNNILTFLEHESEGEQPFPFKRGRMEMERVDFAYRNNQPILEDFSLTIQPGEKVAIVGPSGMGKSTIFALLRGMQFPQRGQVRVDDSQVNQDNAPSLREQIASVSQAAYMFDADLAFNLTLGQERSEAEIQNALRVVGLEEFVAGLPDGMCTRFGPGGFAISGGEKARVCLVRALLMDRPVLLLDEITANIDSIREEKILENVLHGMGDKSVVVISHRLSSVRNFSRIVFLEEGKIRGEGTHHDLLSSCLRYKEMFGNQLKEATRGS
ncbi:ABC transporter ATP-binding protein/permease [Dehalococcoidia bacterium]|nr:ABC transporter ATP-binding protein/permease [Dehalococcoidia bacterium]